MMIQVMQTIVMPFVSFATHILPLKVELRKA